MSADVLAEAEAALREADPLCVEANGLFVECKKLQEMSIVLWARTLFLHDAQGAQLQNMGNLYVLLRHSIESAHAESSARIESLVRARQDLRNLLQELKQLHIDEALGPEIGTLHAYVHTEDIQALDAQVDGLLEVLRTGLSALGQVPDRLQRELAAFRDRQPPVAPQVRNAPMEMAQLSQATVPLAHEMAELLDNLTRHYDLCLELGSLSEAEYAAALAVVESDRRHVQVAVKRIHECHEILLEQRANTENRQQVLENAFTEAADFFERIDTFTSHTLRQHFETVQKRHSATVERFTAADRLIAELTGLADYYRLYRRAYFALVVELARRRQAQQQLRKVVDDANAALAAAHRRELLVRQDFADAYGEYLPPDLWTDSSQLKQYFVEFTEEPIPELSKDSLARALKETQGPI